MSVHKSFLNCGMRLLMVGTLSLVIGLVGCKKKPKPEDADVKAAGGSGGGGGGEFQPPMDMDPVEKAEIAGKINSIPPLLATWRSLLMKKQEDTINQDPDNTWDDCGRPADKDKDGKRTTAQNKDFYFSDSGSGEYFCQFRNVTYKSSHNVWAKVTCAERDTSPWHNLLIGDANADVKMVCPDDSKTEEYFNETSSEEIDANGVTVKQIKTKIYHKCSQGKTPEGKFELNCIVQNYDSRKYSDNDATTDSAVDYWGVQLTASKFGKDDQYYTTGSATFQYNNWKGNVTFKGNTVPSEWKANSTANEPMQGTLSAAGGGAMGGDPMGGGTGAVDGAGGETGTTGGTEPQGLEDLLNDP
ncbi:MAG: hypothetical protein AB7T49_18045 [Oligoflexales bacterium]